MKAAPIELKRWRLLMPSGGTAHVARVTLARGRISRVHTHDFAEIFWVERGTVRHEVDGAVQALSAGALVGVRPARRHRLDAPAGGEGVIFNFAFPAARLRALEAAHPAAVARLFGEMGESCPVLALPDAGLLELRAAGDALLTRPPGELETDYRLLQALRWTEWEAAGSPAVPDWLARGLERVARPDGWVRGLAGLHRACGRSPAQVARVMRATMDTSPIAYLNRLRMEHAERQLRLTPRAIVDISAECGFAGLSQFYRLFIARHGESPFRYRRRHQGTVR
ncbi:MAG: AraC family transcriptional regulator [Rariglobus sp.]|jgi:AraC family cel operon transcriptional repressor|nr:AraC family transcriptional regulator [Rariglobus sp.]